MPKYINEKLKRITPFMLLVRTSEDEKINSIINCFVESLYRRILIFNENSTDTIIKVFYIKYSNNSFVCNGTIDDPIQAQKHLQEYVTENDNTTETLMNYIENHLQIGGILADENLYYPPICIMLNISEPVSKESADKILKMDNDWWDITKKILFLFEDEIDDFYSSLTVCKEAIFRMPLTITRDFLDEICDTLMGTWGCTSGVNYKSIAKDNTDDYVKELIGQSPFELLQYQYNVEPNYMCYGPEPLKGYEQALAELSKIITQNEADNEEKSEHYKYKSRYHYFYEMLYPQIQKIFSKECLEIIDSTCSPNSFQFDIKQVHLDQRIIKELKESFDLHVISSLSISNEESAGLFIIEGMVILLSTHGIWVIKNNTHISGSEIIIKEANWNEKGRTLDIIFLDVAHELIQQCSVDFNSRDYLDLNIDKWKSVNGDII